MLTFREPRAADWNEIGRLADEAVLHIAGPPQQSEWLSNRKAFGGRRRHIVGEMDSRVVAYGAIEQSDASRARLFLVLRWCDPQSETIADALFSRLRQDGSGIDQVWMREYAQDRPFRDFLMARGFKLDHVYEHDGMQVIELVCDSFANV